MLPPTPFLQFVAPRIARAHARLGARMWQVEPDLLEVAAARPTHEHRSAAVVDELEFHHVGPAELPLAWGRKFQQRWWRVKLPAFRAGEGARYLKWRDQGEATLHVRSSAGAWVPSYGIDPGHHYAPLPDDASEVVIESVCCRTGIWVTGETQGVSDRGSIFEGAYLARRDDDAWHAWHDLDVLLALCKLLYGNALPRPYHPTEQQVAGGGSLFDPGGFRTPVEVAPPLLRMLLHRLNDAVDKLEADGPAAMREVTAGIFSEFVAEPWAMTATLTGHAHIDLVWKWPERVGDFKAVHSFATVNSLMERYPELVFGYSQPASYEAVERRSPELMEQVRRRIGGGKWEATGAMYVESDTQLPCGEALVRAVELGQAGFRELGAGDSRVLWLPDVFGYSAAIPTILAGFGVPYFFTTKLHWSGATKFPHSGFRWVGADGSEVVGFIAWEQYNLTASPREVKWAMDNQRQAGLFNETLITTGYGDGGGGPNETMCERARRMADLATLPRCRWGRIDDFFDRLATVKDELPAWRGEMYLEFHRGVQTTHAHLKSAYRAAERGLQAREAARCATGGGPVDVQAWKRVCFAQFHDYLPGSSLQEVYDEGVPELERIAADALEGAAADLAGAGGDDAPRPCVFNALPMERIELIDGRAVRLPPLAGVALDSLADAGAPPVRRERNVVENGRVRAEFTDDGRVARMSVDGREIAQAGPLCGLVWFPDFPAVYDAWDIERPTLSQGQPVETPTQLDFEGDDARQIVRFTRRIGRQSSAQVRYILEAGSPVLKVEMEVDWQDTQALLKVVFPTRYTGEHARYGAPFASALRRQFANTIGDDARFENPASRWATVADETERDGLMLLTESKYGMGCRDGLLHLSLVRSAWVTDADDNPTLRDYSAYGGSGHTPYSDIGRHVIRFAFGHYRADAPRPEQPAALAESLYAPPIRYTGREASAGLLGIDGGDSLIPAWARPEADNAWTLRLHETLGRRGVATLRLAEGWEASLVDLRGEPSSVAGAINESRVAFGPYALLSVRLSRSVESTPG